MKSFLRFLSLTTATHICLAINQIVLLPLQLRVWGRDQTAQWFVVVAIANLASMADLGLRNAGHAHLLTSEQTGHEGATLGFQQTWALARALFIGLTLGLIAGQTVMGMKPWGQPPLWVYAMTLAMALETIVIVRGIWLDTLGHFNKVEAVYLALVAGRIVLSAIILLVFHAPPAVMGWMMLATALVATVAQANLLNASKSLALLAPGFRELRWRALGVVRFVAAEPAANWVRLSLPVVVLHAIETPMFVTTFVALRAVFGMARAEISQISRYASVTYVRMVDANPAAAERTLIRFVLVSTAIGVAVSSLVIADRGRLIGLWLNGADPLVVSLVAISFAVGAAGYGYQVIAGVMMRSGDVPGVAKRQYAYLAAAALAAVLARVFNSALLYLFLLAFEEVLIAGLFIAALGRRVQRASVAAFSVAAGVLIPLWLAAQLNLGGLFDAVGQKPIGISMALAGAATAVMLVLCVAIDRSQASAKSPRAIADDLERAVSK